jgi:hypothetical protein
MHLEDLEKNIKAMQKYTKEFLGVHKEALDFLNRTLYNDYQLNSLDTEPFVLRVVPFPSMLTDLWFRSSGLEQTWRVAWKMILSNFMKDMEELNPYASALVVGRGGPSSDEALYGAWRIFPSIRDNLYLILMHTTGHYDSGAWIFEGDVNDFFTPERFGISKSWDALVMDNPFEYEQVGGEFQKILRVKFRNPIHIEDFGDLYTKFRNKKIMAW